MKLNHFRVILTFLASAWLFSSCTKESPALLPAQPYYHSETEQTFLKSASGFPEGFESATKTSYTTATLNLSSGSWIFNNALVGTSSTDRKLGSKSVRIQSTGSLTLNTDITIGVSKVSFFYARYASESSSTLELWASTNAGSTWLKVGNTVSVTSTTLSQASFSVNYTGPVRFQIRKISGGRLNIDEIDIQDLSPSPTRDDHLTLGNPSSALPDISQLSNYLMVKSQYALSYNNAKGSANWVSWHLSAAWKGTAARCDCFASDNTLPAGFYKAPTTSYSLTGFDRGHLCPSEDRDSSSSDNASTFLMTNMMPQSPNLNRITWVAFENYCRSLMEQGNELYIYSGGYGSGGTGSNGGITYNIASGQINVPSHCWKIAVILPVGNNDLSRISSTTRVISVLMPNTQTVNTLPWSNYRTSIDQLEQLTGYDFLDRVDDTAETILEAQTDAVFIP